MSDTILPFNHTGDFTITTGAAGAPLLKVILSVPMNSNTVTGHGTLTNGSLQPPLNAPGTFNGLVSLDVFGAHERQIYSLQGTASPPRPGVTYVNQLSIRLGEQWEKEGTATYSYITGGVDEPPNVVDQVPVTVVWLLRE
jgi:hypothetical protein